MCHVNSWWRWSDLLVASHSDLLSVPCTHGNTDKCCKTGPNTWNCFRFVFFFKLSCGGRRGRSSTNGEVGSSIACYIYTWARYWNRSCSWCIHVLMLKSAWMHVCECVNETCGIKHLSAQVEKSAIKTGPFNIYHLSTLTRGVLTSARSQCSLAWQYSSALSEAWRPSSLGNGWKQNKLLKR